MNNRLLPLALLVGLFMSLTLMPAAAQQHRATRLGNPATRFAPPLQEPDDLRRLLCSEALRADVDSIVRQCNYQGDVADLRHAASNAVILEIQIPVGTRLPAMSSRKNGKPVLLHDVLWAGQEPFDAYEFFFSSQGRRFRLVAPKPCANFWVEDFGEEGRPELALTCHATQNVLLRQPVEICLTVRNTGDARAAQATVTLPIPANTTFVRAGAGGKSITNHIVWELTDLPPQGSHQLCATVNSQTTGPLPFTAAVRAGKLTATTDCATRVGGVPAVQLEVIDLNDPIEVGENETYEIRVTNQGSETLTNLKVVCQLEEAQEFVSGSGSSEVSSQDRTVTAVALAGLKPGEIATWKVVAKTLQPGDVRFSTELTCDQFASPITEVEATQQY